MQDFQSQIRQGIPDVLPTPQAYDSSVNHAPKRKDILTADEKNLALRNALRYFEPKHHATLLPEFKEELEKYGRIYMYRFRPTYKMCARPIDEYPAKSKQAAAIMLMIQNNLDYAVAQHPHELITYGGNGAVFQNWAQYLLTMKYLSEMTDEQTLVMYSGHPMGLFPSHKDAPRVVVTNGMMIPNYSKPDDWERFNALGVTQYGQMTAGSYMYIGPQGIVHGTTITVMNAARKIAVGARHASPLQSQTPMLFITAGLGGMSGAQPKAGNIAGCVSITAEINPKATHTRHSQGWVDEVHDNLEQLFARVKEVQAAKQIPLSAPCVWGPYVVHDSCLLATSDGKLHCVNAEGNIQSVDSASPIGKPWVESDGVVLTSLTGRLWKLNVSDLKTIFSHETDIPTLVGAVRFGGHYILCGKDGSISRVNSP